MTFLPWLRWSSTRRTTLTRRPRLQTVAPRNGRVPRLDVLEDRTLPSTFTVLNLNDSGTGSLRAEIAAANANPGADTINFAHGLHGTITLTSGELLITDSVTINGPGANQLSISGNNASRVFEMVAGRNVTISGATITDGHALDYGGGILNDGSNLTLSGDDLLQNVTYENTTDTNAANGGALDNLGGNLNITACTIANNQALGGTGASASGEAVGGGINLLAGSLTISNSMIQGNLAQGGADSIYAGASGGAIDQVYPPTGITGTVITNCIINDNRAIAGDVPAASTAPAAANGGAVGLEGVATISGTTFSGNECVGGNGGTYEFAGEAEGGAISNYGFVVGGNPGTVAISGSTFMNNLSQGGSDGNSGSGSADPGVDESFGAGIFNYGGPVNVSNTTFSGNKSIGGNDATATGTDIVEVGVAEGGAICSEIGAASTFSGCTFNNNQAIGGNGNSGNGPVVHVGAGFGAGIFSGFGGPASFVGSNSLTVSNTTFAQNQAAGGDNNTGTASVEGLVGVGAGAGIMNALGSTASVSGSTLNQNQASGGYNDTATVTGTASVFSGTALGGGIVNDLANYDSTGYGQFSNSVLTVIGCTISSNQALGAAGASAVGDADGGGICELGGSATISNSTISSNLAQGGNNSSDGQGDGGGLFTFSSATVTGCTFSGNQAIGSSGGTGPGVGEGLGGAVSELNGATVSISGSTLDHNLAQAGSNGISGTSSPVPFVDYAFGGAINAEFLTTLTVSTSSFSHNQAVGGNNGTATGTDVIGVGGAEGGAIINEVGAVANVANCTFDHNLAQGGNGNTGSGAVVLVGEGLGGAIVSGYGSSAVGANTLTVSDSTLTQNNAQGGDNNSGTATVTGLVGAGAGAGIANYAGGTTSVSGSDLDHGQAVGGHHNTASGPAAVFAGLGAGAGIFNYLGGYNSSAFGLFYPSTVNVSNSTIDHHQAQAVDGGSALGGGIANVLDATTMVAGSTITQNQVNGGGAGYGGGFYNDATSSLALMDCSVTQNHANGSPGIGGGVYTLGTFAYDASTVIADNHASTSDDNIGP